MVRASLNRLAHCLAGLLCAALASGSGAHDTWLLPVGARFDAPVPVTLGLTSGDLFPQADSGFRPDRLAEARFRLRGAHLPLQTERVTASQLLLRLVPSETGLATVTVSVKPFDIEIEDRIVQLYFDEINASSTQRTAWANAGPERRWQERFVKHAKTHVRFGANDATAEWSAPAGVAYEIVPETDPTALAAGNSLTVRVLKHGMPLAGLPLAAVRERQVVGGFVITDSEGRARFSLPQAGWWLIRGTELRQRDASGMRWDSDWVSLSLWVSPDP